MAMTNKQWRFPRNNRDRKAALKPMSMSALQRGKEVASFIRDSIDGIKRISMTQARKWLSWSCFVAAPALGILALFYRLSLETDFWKTAPHSSYLVAAISLVVLGASLLLLYLAFVSMILTWDIDRISYAVEEEAQRQFLKRIVPDKEVPDEATVEREIDTAAGGRSTMDSVLENLITRRAEFLWQNLLQSGCIDFPRANVKLAMKTIREEHPTQDTGILDALKTLIVSKLFARRYVPRLRLKIMDKLVFKFVREISFLFVSVWIVFLATVLLWAVLTPSIFLGKAEIPSIFVFVADLTLRGAIFTIVDHLGLSLTHLAPSPNAKAFAIHTLGFRLFMSLFVIATIIKLVKLTVRRHALAA
jgi:hypothetical protein